MHARRVRQPGGDIRAGRRPTRSVSAAGRRRSPARVSPRTDLFAADDIRRLIAAAASAVVPGFGQLLNGRLRLAKWFGVPALVLIAFVALRVATSSPARLLASVISPTTLGVLLALNVVVLGWRLVAVLHAFFDTRFEPRSGRGGAAGLALILVAVVVPHGLANSLGTSAQAAFSNVFAGRDATGPGSNAASTSGGPGSNDRLNILVVGVDSLQGRTETLADSLMVVSVDPVGKSVSMVSLPRDIIRMPLGDGNTFGPKINSLMSYADRHKDQFPQGGMQALEDSVGALLGVPIHYYARIDLMGFVNLIDSVGGVDVNVKKGFDDPQYDGLGINAPGVNGWSITAGPHHFNGYEALAYARSRYALGESDFTRAARQQEILIALKARLLSDGSLLTQLPQLLDAFGALVRTNVPTDRLPDLAAIADELGSGSIYRMVLGHPLVKPGNDPVYGSVQTPDLAAIKAAAAAIMPKTGQTPVAWSATAGSADPAPDPTAAAP